MGGITDDRQMSVGIKTILNILSYAWGKLNYVHSNSDESSIYEISYFQSYEQGQVRFARNFSNFEIVEQNQMIAFLDEEPVCTPIAGKILLYPKQWFLENSTVKPDGIFAVLTKVNSLIDVVSE